MSNIQQVAKNAQETARKLGIEKFDIYGSTVDDTSVQVDQGEPKQVKASNRSGVTVRVWNEENTMGVTSTTDVDPQGLELALQTAYEASFFGVKENVPDFSPEATLPIESTPKERFAQAPVSELIDKLLLAEKELLDSHPAINGVPYNGLSQRDIERFYLNSNGALRKESHSLASIYLYSKTEQEGKKPRSAGAYRVKENLGNLDIAGCIKEAADKTISHLDYQKVKTGRYQVVFSPEAFLSLLGAFSNLFNAQNILDNQSLSQVNDLGKQIASPLLSVYDDALHPANVGAETFDGEGTPTRQIKLIEKGILTSFLHSAGTAKRLNAQPTGNASIGAKVTVSPNFYHVFAANTTEEEFSLQTAENVILIDDLQALHAGVKALQGSFSLPFDGWLVNKGEKISIDSATVAGDFLELLKSIVYIEKEPELTPGGVCPRIWVGELSITGD
ncbi:TldD/PmbA family protein [Cylindrospermopsis raciborskii]|uniref:Peptidase C69 n=1 Tax=Cylindrospermopsis raciborskii CENA302 TaxID=1170768 RepID=A0A9Q5QZG3_9CYAN|nr:TldD/PmbA family protein [Cylindrospermopsis raciborskii]MCZ2202451.1 TldD/PmbA family protein [Cylindrospermopsis raciborskii PAMP2012]MCZ2206989.1 TldD/PmbA family protein [Cylindrospermopsis raciborskii PAMP2011]NLQ04654.1 TldD/PmbA family protein [Cylindrospermopsis raciborskii MVCC19]OHY32970.1 peptidase C69 [Cylindrospermopsis raciborskii MVCC14]OPH11253.1 peptidase C69 [Cylindrospermopsis raciborskii CENA302]